MGRIAQTDRLTRFFWSVLHRHCGPGKPSWVAQALQNLPRQDLSNESRTGCQADQADVPFGEEGGGPKGRHDRREGLCHLRPGQEDRSAHRGGRQDREQRQGGWRSPQGGLHPDILLTNKKNLKKKVGEYLKIFNNHPYIFNLGHGILPTTEIDMVEELVKVVREFR